MARVFPVFLLLATVCSLTAAAQDRYPPEFDSLRSAIAEGDAKGILAMAGTRLEIGLFGSTRTYSRSQALYVLRGFFEENPPESMTMGRATGTDEGWFAAGEYVSSRAGAPIRMYVRLRMTEGAWQLRELVIRKET